MPIPGCFQYCSSVEEFKVGIVMPLEISLAGEMTQWLRALAALPEDPSSIPSTHMAARACL